MIRYRTRRGLQVWGTFWDDRRYTALKFIILALLIVLAEVVH